MVHFLLLGLGLLLPWALGTLLLFPRDRLRNKAALTALLGYGFFLGYALTALLLWLGARALGFFPVPAIAALEALGVLGLLWRVRPLRAVAAAPPQDAVTTRGGLLTALLLAAIGVHLAAIALEIIYRPLFPWDGWLNWMYRAKVWFYSDQLLPFAEPGDAVIGATTAIYNVDGAAYPPLLPLLALWSARCYGAWTDTLINLPTLLAAGALAMAVYGQCRALRIDRRVALCASYGLLSIPLVGTHFALAGQADIWLACYASLGIIAVYRGLLLEERGQLILGLSLCVIGAAVKLEGALWALLAFTLLTGRYAPARTWPLAWALFLALALFAWLAPASLWTAAVTEGLGSWMPVMAGSGSSPELADDYAQNYLFGGSWHLAGWLALLTFPILLGQALRTQRFAQLALLFLGLQGSMLLVIFNYSTNSAWAEDWTAINRLPLQLVPMQVVIWAMLAEHLRIGITTPVSLARRGTVILLPLLLGGLLGAGLLVSSSAEQSGDRRFPAAALRAVVGSGSQDSDELLLAGYRNNLAVASSGPVSVDLRLTPLVSVYTGGENRRSASFFWRSAGDPQQLASRPLPVRGSAIIDLREVAADTGVISEFGVLAYGDNDHNPLRIGAVTFRSPAPATLLHKLWLDWTQPVFWTQRSAHWIAAGSAEPLYPLPLAAALLLLVLAATSLGAARRDWRQSPQYLLPGLLVLWVLLDARWLANRLQQAERTLQIYPPVTATTHDFSNDQLMAQSMGWALDGVSDEDSPLLISAQRADMRYEMLRAKYQLAPRPALVLENLDARALRPGSELLLLRSPYGGGAGDSRELNDYRDLLRGSDLLLRTLKNSPTAALARVEQRGQ